MRRHYPPYGRVLLEKRAALLASGQCPGFVRVIFGKKSFQARVDEPPCICLLPQEWAPGIYNWEPLAGLPVEIAWQDGELELISALLVEVAAVAAPIWVMTPSGRRMAPGEFLLLARPRPPGWSDDDEADYTRREFAYFRALALDSGALERTDGRREQEKGKALTDQCR